MTTHQEIPKVQVDVVVCIDVPVADSNPVAPPPPPTAGDTSEEYCLRLENTFRFISLIIILCLVISGIIYVLSNPHPRFKVESMSVALDKTDISNNQSRAIRATLGFSIKNRPRLPRLEISVSFWCMSSNWSANIIEDVLESTTSVDADVITLLPREFVLPELKVRGLTLPYDDVSFQTDYMGGMVEGVCKNMTVVISPNETRGVMVGGQRWCHYHSL